MRNAGAYFRSWFEHSDRAVRLHVDLWLAGPAAALLVFGLLMVLDTTYFLGEEKGGDPFHFFKSQLTHVALGLGICALFSQFSLKGLRRITLPLGFFALATLLLVWVPGFGIVRGGARRWVHLGPILTEPSELVKLALTFVLAAILAKREAEIEEFDRGPLPVFVVVGPLALVTLAQPDFGATVMIVIIAMALLFAAGVRTKHLAIPGGAAFLILGVEAIARPYRLRRFVGFLDPWRTARGAGFQLIQSFIALGNGGTWGQGLGLGRQKMFYLPQAHNDFIFAVITEDFGLVGALVVLSLFVIILIRGMRIASAEPDSFGSLLAVGLTLLISLQALVNVAVVIGLTPTKGLPLPFLSYGGTSTVTALAALGALLALSRRSVPR
jgi:cell division protein FtsW